MTQVLVKDIIAPVWQLCPSCPLNIVVQAYIDAARKFCNKTRWLKTTIPGATIIDQRSYALGSDPYNEIIGLSAIDLTESASKITSLTESLSSSWDTTEANDVPTKYQYIPEGQFALHPKPLAIYTLAVGIVMQPKAGSNSVDDSLLVNWSYALQQGALSYLLAMPNKPWTDKQAAGVNYLMFKGAMDSAAISAERGYNAGAQSTDVLGPRNATTRTKMQAI